MTALPSILIVDDDRHVTSAWRRYLQRDHDVQIACRAMQALEMLEGDHAFDVILCDLMMPVVDGIEFHRRVCALDPDLAARIVFVTGGIYTDDAQAFLDSVPNKWLQKPIEPGELRAVIERVVMTRAS